MSKLNKKETISILGCGWFGLELAKEMVVRGYDVKGSTTSNEKKQLLKVNGIEPFLLDVKEDNITVNLDFFVTDTLVITIPPLRAAKEQHTFVSKIRRIIDLITFKKISKVMFISSTSVYNDDNTEVDELTPVNPTTDSGKSIAAAEELLRSNASFDTTIVRFSGLIGPNREPGNFFAGKTGIPNGQAPINLIHRIDCVNLCLSIVEKEAYGFTFNGCCPDHPQKQNFYRSASQKIGVQEPQFVDELKNWKIVTSSNVEKILNYTYQIQNWDLWLKPTEK
jgi:nucleoside-diphosphate-sugar epimerase